MTGGAAPYTAADRDAALERLLRWIHPEDMEDARNNLWGEHLSLRDQCKDPVLLQMVDHALHFWLFFDEVSDGQTLADELLESESDLRPGERRYLEMGRDSSMRLYEVIHVEPGASITLRDTLQGSEIRVRERSASRSVHVWDMLAARVMPKGVSGQPEIDGGCFPLRKSVRDELVMHLEELEEDLEDPELKAAVLFVFFDAWIGPGMPKLVNFDGEPLLLTKVHFDVVDEAALIKALDHAPDLLPEDDSERKTKVWTWVGKGKQREEPIVRGRLQLDQDRLKIETNSRERGEAAKTVVERLAGTSVRYRVTEHQDPERAALEHAREGREPEALPDELREPAREAVVQMLQQHYEKWLDEPVPALDGFTPRAAAGMDALRPRVAGMIEDLEGMYERALQEGSAAFDPTWMWEELGLEDLARGRLPGC